MTREMSEDQHLKEGSENIGTGLFYLQLRVNYKRYVKSRGIARQLLLR